MYIYNTMYIDAYLYKTWVRPEPLLLFPVVVHIMPCRQLFVEIELLGCLFSVAD